MLDFQVQHYHRCTAHDTKRGNRRRPSRSHLKSASASTYMLTARKGNASQNFSLTLVMIPASLRVIILLVGTTWRSALRGVFDHPLSECAGDPEAISPASSLRVAAGLACGVGLRYTPYCLLLSCLAMLILHKVKFGRPRGKMQNHHSGGPQFQRRVRRYPQPVCTQKLSAAAGQNS